MAVFLIVDDMPEILDVYDSLLSSMDHEVVRSSNGKEAFDYISSSQNIDGIICDLEMPRMDGKTFLDLLKSSEQYKNIPVIVCTAYKSENEIHEVLEMGATFFMAKPLNLKELTGYIRNISNMLISSDTDSMRI